MTNFVLPKKKKKKGKSYNRNTHSIYESQENFLTEAQNKFANFSEP